jgi:hypothetical protein
MQYQVTKMLKCMIDSLFSNAMTSEEVLIDFFNKSELALEDEYKQDLLQHLQKYVA